MREKWELFKASLTEENVITRKEWLLTIAVAVLAGIVFGTFASPRKNITIGSHNGNNCGNNTDKENKEQT